MPTVQEVLERAMSMVGRGTLYWAGTGGLDPRAASPAETLAVGREWPRLPPDRQAELRPIAQAAGLDLDDPRLVAQACDCSGFVCWALGISRRDGAGAGDDEDQWINTDSIWNDAIHEGARFYAIDRATPGCLVVYPQKDSRERFGHVGLVSEVGADGRAASVVHCSATNFSTAPFDAIEVNAGEAFQRQPKSIYAWFRGMTP
jgi:hypothetical protein